MTIELGAIHKAAQWECTHGNEEVGHLSLILEPGLAVLGPAPLDITQRTVGDHASKEERVEPREGARKAGDQSPIKGEVQIAGIVDLAGFAV